MKKFLVYIERKPGFSGNSIPKHRDFLQSQRESGHLISTGGFIDQTGGAYVLQAKTNEDAFQIMAADPMYTENECVYTIKEWNVQ